MTPSFYYQGCMDSLVFYKRLLLRRHKSGIDNKERAALEKECTDLLNDLRNVDPDRRQRYLDLCKSPYDYSEFLCSKVISPSPLDCVIIISVALLRTRARNYEGSVPATTNSTPKINSRFTYLRIDSYDFRINPVQTAYPTHRLGTNRRG